MAIIRLIKAWRSMEPADWSRLAALCTRACRYFPRSATVWMLAGKVLKAAERYSESIAAFHNVVRLAPRRPEGFILLGQVLQLSGDRNGAIGVLETALGLGDTDRASRLLCRYGARDKIADWVSGIAPVRDYGRFLARHPVGAPPSIPGEEADFAIVIDNRGAALDAVRATMASVDVQTYSRWTGRLVDGQQNDGLGHSLDTRWRHALGDAMHERADKCWHVQLPAGTILDPHALGWLAWTIERTGCAQVYADSDQHVRVSEGRLDRTAPFLHPMFDRFWFADPDKRPVLVASLIESPSAQARKFGKAGPVAHVPRLLASAPSRSRAGLENTPSIFTGRGRISVIIPTRDNPALLRPCVQSLFGMATDRERLEIVIVDNGSTTGGAHALFAELSATYGTQCRIVRFPESFHWPRANQAGVAASDGDHLLFLNDDTQMLVVGWDNLVAGLLEAKADVGIIGARMLYPNGTLQHGGFIFGMDNGPQHEGRWMPAEQCGPDGRWLRQRQCVAVTGAFMAMRRAVFGAVGGFDDARYSVDFADVDICLRVRAEGYAVLYEPRITLLHYESVSRGYNRSRAKRARARREFAMIRSVWGPALDHDPGYNPYWTREGYGFDGYREPSVQEIVAHIDASARANPWSVDVGLSVPPC